MQEENLETELRKMEVRLKEFIEAENKATESIRKCINKFTELNSFVQSLSKENIQEQLQRALELRLEAIEAFYDALEKMSKAEHEKSHLLESYGSIFLALEEQFQKLLGK